MSTVNYTSLLGLALPTQGDLSGQWGTEVNNYITTYLDTAIAGQLAISLTGNLTLTKSTGTSLGSTSSQYAILNVTPSASTWTITVPAASQIYHINNLSSTHTFTIKASGQTGFVVAAAEKCVVAYNGTDFVRVGSTSVFGSPSTAMTIDTAGIIGVGVTPSAWGSGLKFIQMGNGAGANGAFGVLSNNLTQVITNAYYDGTNYRYIAAASTQASAYNQTVGQHQWFNAPSGTAGNAITFTQAMTLNASGNLLVGNTTETSTATPVKLSTGGTYGTSLQTGMKVMAFESGATNHGMGIVAGLLYLNTGDTANIGFGIANVEKMRLDASGNLGLGVTPSARTVGKAIEAGQVGNSLWGVSAANVYVTTNTTYNGAFRYGSNGFASFYVQNDSVHSWHIAPSGTAGNAITFTQAMTLDASGNLLLNTSTLTAASVGTSGTLQINSEAISRGSNAGWFWENRSGGTTSNTNWYGWYTTGGTIYLWNGGANAATINPSTGVYTAVSDRNKKKDFEPSAIGLNEVMRLKPTLFRMLDDADDSAKKLGFIAQDVADVIPQAYVEHRAVDAGGKDSVYIGLDDRPFIAALTKAIQEQQAMIQSLTDRIIQLEAK